MSVAQVKPFNQAYFLANCACGCLAGGKRPRRRFSSGGPGPDTGICTAVAVVPAFGFSGYGSGSGSTTPTPVNLPDRCYLSKKITQVSSGTFGSGQTIKTTDYQSYFNMAGTALQSVSTSTDDRATMPPTSTAFQWRVPYGTYFFYFSEDTWAVVLSNSFVWTDNKLVQTTVYGEQASVRIIGLYISTSNQNVDVDGIFTNPNPDWASVKQTVVTTTELSRLTLFDSLASPLLDQIDLYDPNLYYTYCDQPTNLLRWSPVTGATQYKVKVATAIGGPFTTIAIGNFTRYAHSPQSTDMIIVNHSALPHVNPVFGTTYYYKVCATIGGTMGGGGIIVGGTDTDDSQGVMATPQFPDNPVSYDAIVFPPDPSATPSAGAPQNLTVFFYNPQTLHNRNSTGGVSVGWFGDQGSNWTQKSMILIFPLAGGKIGLSSSVVTSRPQNAGDWVLAANQLTKASGLISSTLLTGIAATNGDCLFYAKSIGFLLGTATYYLVPPLIRGAAGHFYYQHAGFDGSAAAVDVTANRPALSFPNGIGFGYPYLDTDQLEFNPSDVGGSGELYYML